METYALTNQGLERKENQDRYFVREFEDRTILLAVADGMGGEAGGGLAAQKAIEAIKEFNLNPAGVEAAFDAVFQEADRRISEITRQNPRFRGMGTTLTAAYLIKEEIQWAHVGDSRLYRFRDGGLAQITEDDTFVHHLAKGGVITQAQARNHPLQNILLYCLGCPPLRVSHGRFKVEKDDLVLLCSDGLYHQVSEKKMVSILKKKVSLQKKLEGLLQAALDNGGHDNITLVSLMI